MNSWLVRANFVHATAEDYLHVGAAKVILQKKKHDLSCQPLTLANFAIFHLKFKKKHYEKGFFWSDFLVVHVILEF